MTDSETIQAWLSGTLALTACSSAFILSLQRVHLHKTQNVDLAPLKFDTKRDPTVPVIDDENRLTRLTFGTIILTLLSAFNFYDFVIVQKQDNWIAIASVCAQFVTWLYASVLVIVSRRYHFPSKWGWILNVHLCIIYSTIWCIAVYNVYNAYVSKPFESWLHMLPTLLALLLSTDLVYTTGTVPRGPPFVDENGKKVNGISQASIFSYLYFSWVTPLIHYAYNKKTLTDDDLPTLPPLYRGYNLYYIFGETRGKSLLKRIYLANKSAIIIQIVLAFVTSLMYYVPAYFINQLLTLIQNMNGNEDSESIRIGFVIVTGLGIAILVVGILTAQLWYYGMLFMSIFNKFVN